jgi:PIN domain nuclease of toxin-antitoxin system
MDLGLPHHHSDPFDRLLIAQALFEPLILLTADKKVSRYSEQIRLV